MTRWMKAAAAAVVAALALTLTFVGVASSAPDNSGNQSLRILLTNDDGANRGYIDIVRQKLCAAGHSVTVVAPSGDQSGNSSRFTTARGATIKASTSTFPCGSGTGTQYSLASSFTAGNSGGGTYTYNGPASPADSVKFALGVVFAGNPPDLVVSGANPGQNMSSVVLKSGTVGAALTAAQQGVPAIALSVAFNPADNPAGGFPQAQVAAGALGDWTNRLIAELQANAKGGALLAPGLSLNVNYPTVLTNGTFDPTKVGPAVLTVTGDRDLIPVGYVPVSGSPGTYSVNVSLCGLSSAPQCTAPEVKDADTTAIDEGKISVTPMDGDVTVLPPQSTGLQKVINALNR